MSPNEVMKVWLVSSTNSKERRLIYTHSRSIKVLFSDQDKWFIITDYEASNESNVHLFVQKKGIDFRQAENISDAAWKYFATRMALKKGPNLDHIYAEALRWTDSHTVLLCLHGHLDSHNFVDDWICFYDVKSKTFSTDLDSHNKRHTTLEIAR